MITKPLDLIRIDVGRAHFHCSGQIDDHWPIRGRCQYLVHRIANRYREIHLRTGKTLGAVLKYPLCFGAGVCGFLDQAGAVYSNIPNTVPVETKDVFPLHRRGAVVKMHHGSLDALECGKGFFNEVRPRLHKHLHGDVVGNAVLFDQLPQKGKIMA